jgi:hypothetical protein
MTIQELINRVVKRWWIILLITLIVGGGGFYTLNNKTYIASVNVGMDFVSANAKAGEAQNNSEIYTKTITSEVAYSDMLGQLGKYLSSRYSSLNLQTKIAKEVGVELPATAEKKPFYDVMEQGSGFVTLNYKAAKKEEADKFIQVVREINSAQLANEWNGSRNEKFKVQPAINAVATVSEFPTPIESKLLPALAALIAASCLSSLIPTRSESKEKKTA